MVRTFEAKSYEEYEARLKELSLKKRSSNTWRDDIGQWTLFFVASEYKTTINRCKFYSYKEEFLTWKNYEAVK